jgi:hypothetical protein
MIEEGDQGEPFKERVKAIREDGGWMRSLEEEWSYPPEIDHGFCTDDEDDADEDEDKDDSEEECSKSE